MFIYITTEVTTKRVFSERRSTTPAPTAQRAALLSVYPAYIQQWPLLFLGVQNKKGEEQDKLKPTLSQFSLKKIYEEQQNKRNPTCEVPTHSHAL